jgi:photosystem II stability/assembly factor-like uncharacterized protein
LKCPAAAAAGAWQRLAVPPFPVADGVAAVDEVRSLAVDPTLPQRVLASNGTTVTGSYSHGCAWQDLLTLDAAPSPELPVSGAISTIVGIGLLPAGRTLLAVQEGTGAASRPHVLVGHDLEPGSFRTSDTGLPRRGSPALLRVAADGRTVYLLITAVGDGVAGDAPLEGRLPPGLSAALYASEDGGTTWSPWTPAQAALADGPALRALSVDPRDPSVLYGIVDSGLVVSEDGGRTFKRPSVPGEVGAVTATGPGELAVFTREGQVFFSTDRGQRFSRRRTLPGVRSAAARAGDRLVAVETAGSVWLVDPRTGAASRAPADGSVQPGTLTGDRSGQATFHAVSGHGLLRYLGPGNQGGAEPGAVPSLPAVAVGDLSPPPPPRGTVQPARRAVTLPVGSAADLEFALRVPKSPTPVDLFFLVDTSASMRPFIDELKADIGQITADIAAAGVDLQVGVGTIGTGPQDGDPPYPLADPVYDSTHPEGPPYRKPVLYGLLRRIGPADDGLADAVASIRVETTPTSAGATTAEGQLIALQQLMRGDGVPDPSSQGATYAVPPGQQAGFRPLDTTRRVVVHASDEAFANPAGTPRRDGLPDTDGVARELKSAGIRQIGLSVGSRASLPDLARVAGITGATAAPGGARCGSNAERLSAGAPLVCSSAVGFAPLIVHLVSTLTDQQQLTLAARSPSTAVGRISGGQAALDLTRAHTVPFTVTASCRDTPPGRYVQPVDAVLRGSVIATATVEVTCLEPARAVAQPAAKAVAPVPAGAPAPVPAAALAPAVPAPPPPAANAQANPQAQSQPQPLTAAALREQEQLQAALALQLVLQQETPGQQLAMVNRRPQQHEQALALLTGSMLAATALAAVRLREQRAAPAGIARRAAGASRRVPTG